MRLAWVGAAPRDDSGSSQQTWSQMNPAPANGHAIAMSRQIFSSTRNAVVLGVLVLLPRTLVPIIGRAHPHRRWPPLHLRFLPSPPRDATTRVARRCREEREYGGMGALTLLPLFVSFFSGSAGATTVLLRPQFSTCGGGYDDCWRPPKTFKAYLDDCMGDSVFQTIYR
jgi:hypothetical protein